MEHFGKSDEQVQHLVRLILFLRGFERELILQVRSSSLSQGMCPRNILEKVGSRPNTWGAYLIFARSWEGGHFAGQAPKPVTRNVSKEHFGKSGEQVQDLGGLI